MSFWSRGPAALTAPSVTAVTNVREAAPGAAGDPFLRSGVLNVMLRGATLGSKFLFLVYIGKTLPVSDMAVYGLLTTTVGISITLLGWEFYAFSTREILARPGAERAVYIRDQLVFHAVAYLVLLPLAVPAFASGVLRWSLAPWFYALTILEHLAQENARLLNTLFRPVLSTALYFLRSAGWCYLVIGLGLYRREWNNLSVVWAAWAGGVAVSLALGFRELRKLDWSLVRTQPVDWGWIRKGVWVSVPFFASAVCYRVVELSDRYLIHFMLTDTAVGVYSFYGTLANVVPAIIGAGVTSILVPRIIGAFQAGHLAEYRRLLRGMVKATLLVLGVTLPLVFGVVALVQAYLAKPEYSRELATGGLLLLSTAAGVVAQLPGVALYARKDDLALLRAVVLAAVLNTVLNLVLIRPFGIAGAAWATIIAYAAMGLHQYLRLIRFSRLASTPQ